MTDVVALAAELLAIQSFTRDEGAAIDFAARWLVTRGWNVTVQEVTPGRSNVWASRSGGGVTLSTQSLHITLCAKKPCLGIRIASTSPERR